MKQKHAIKLDCKKIFLGILLCILGIAGATVLGVFLWMQTWKTYQFPDGQGSIRYPSNWTLDIGGLGKDHYTNSSNQMLNFASINNTTISYEKNFVPVGGGMEVANDLIHLIIDIVRYPLDENRTFDKTIAKQYSYLLGKSSYPMLVPMVLDGNPGYVAKYGSNNETYLAFHNNEIYSFEISFTEKGSEILLLPYRVVLNLIISTIKFSK